MKPRFLLITAATLLVAAVPAYAGFTLVTPDNPTPASAVPITPVQTAPVSSFQSQTTIDPSSISRTHVGPTQVELMPAPAPNVMPPQTMIVAAPMIAPVAAEPAVKGFGKDIPLVIAAQQIAPADRQIAFGQGVDPSMPVSWHGGQPWHVVLSDALNKRGLQMTEQGTLLFISQSKSELGTNKASLLMQPKDSFNTSNSPVNTAPTDLSPMPLANSNVVPAPIQTSPPIQAMAAPIAMPTTTQIAPTVAKSNPPVVVAPSAVSVAPLPDITQPIPVSAVAAVPLRGTVIAAPAHVPAQTTWHASAGQTLKQTLESWSHSANITLRWDSEYDYPVQASVTMNGDYEAAVRSLLRGFSNAQPQPIARLYHPSQGMVGVLLVTDRGNDMSMSQ